MNKDDAPRLKSIVKLLMGPTYSGMSGRQMIEFTNHMEWLAKHAHDLENPKAPDIQTVGPPKPLDKKPKKGKK